MSAIDWRKSERTTMRSWDGYVEGKGGHFLLVKASDKSPVWRAYMYSGGPARLGWILIVQDSEQKTVTEFCERVLQLGMSAEDFDGAMP